MRKGGLHLVIRCVQVSCGARSGSVRDPFGVRSGSVRGPFEFSDLFVSESDPKCRYWRYYGNPMKAFEEMDKNHDGLLSPLEWAGGSEQLT